MSRSRLLPAALLTLLALTGPLAGCGGVQDSDAADGASARSSSGSAVEAETGESEEGEEVAGTPATVDCPEEATAVDLPADFAAPLPAGTVVVDVAQRDGGRTVVTGVVPTAEPDVLADLQEAYPAAGLTLTEGETEERDAESDFTGGGVAGRWGIRALSGCSPEATRIDVVVRAD